MSHNSLMISVFFCNSLLMFSDGFSQLLLADLPSSAGLLEIAPVYKRQQESWDKVFFLQNSKLAGHGSYCVSGPENPVSSVAAGDPAG